MKRSPKTVVTIEVNETDGLASLQPSLSSLAVIATGLSRGTQSRLRLTIWPNALFAIGVIAVGFLAVPIMTTGAAYDVCQAFGWKHSLHARPSEAKRFYMLIAGFTAIAMSVNFLGFNPMKALVFAGIVQGFSTPPLMLLIMRMTGNRAIMGDAVSGRGITVLGWTTTAAIFGATAGLVCTWLL